MPGDRVQAPDTGQAVVSVHGHALHEVLRRRPFIWGQAAAEVALANAQAGLPRQPNPNGRHRARQAHREQPGGGKGDQDWREDKAKKWREDKGGKDPKGKGKHKGGKDPKGKGKKNGKQSKDDGYIRHPKGTW